MLPAEYKNTFSRYTNLLKFIGINIFESSASSRYSKIRLLAFNMIFLPFAIGQFSLIAKIRAHNFLEAVRVVPISVVFLLGKISYERTLLYIGLLIIRNLLRATSEDH